VERVKTSYMNNKSYTVSIELAKPAQEVFNSLLEVPKWWSKDFEGKCERLDDEFVIHHPGAHYSRQQLVEVIPSEKLVWNVVASELDWLEGDRHEWTNTNMVFEISTRGGRTLLHFTHEGLVPGKECYTRCSGGWHKVITERLYGYIMEGKVI